MKPEVRKLIEKLYPTGKYGDIDENICMQYFNRAEATSIFQRIAGIPDIECHIWEDNPELRRSFRMVIYPPGRIYTWDLIYRSKQDRIKVLKAQGGHYCTMSLRISNIAPFYERSWSCERLIHLGRDYEIDVKGETNPPDSFWKGVAVAIETILSEYNKNLLTVEEGSEAVPWLDVSGTELDDMMKPATVSSCFFDPSVF